MNGARGFLGFDPTGPPRERDGPPITAASALAGVILAHAHDGLPFGAVLGIALFTAAMRGATLRQCAVASAALGALESAAFWGFLLASPIVLPGAFAIHTLSRVLFGLALHFLLRGRDRAWLGSLSRAAGAPLVWVGLEWLRTLGPLHPLALGDAFAYHTWFIQIADLGGTYAISFTVVAMGIGIALAFLERARCPLLVGGAAFATAMAYGVWRSPPPDRGSRTIQVAIAQYALPSWVYTLAALDPEVGTVFETTYLSTLARTTGRVDLLVWPETTAPFDPQRAPLFRDALERPGRPTLLAGLPRRSDEGATFNTAWLLPRRGAGAATSYDKRRLVPVVESLLTAGKDAVVLEGDGLKIAPLICWESAFPGLATHAAGADLIAVLTDDSAFGHSNVSELHARRSILRAVEARRPLIHAAQTGPSLIVDESGRVLARLEPWAVGVLEHAIRIDPRVPRGASSTPSHLRNRAREIFPSMCVVLGLLAVVVSAVRSSSISKR